MELFLIMAERSEEEVSMQTGSRSKKWGDTVLLTPCDP